MRQRQGLPLFLVLALLFAGLAGCLGGPENVESSDAGEPRVVTDPSDFEALNDSDGAHLHDYWGGKDRLLLMEASQEGGVGLWFGDAIPVVEFLLQGGSVVPQGTQWVEATLSWQDAPGDQYGPMELWVKNAADNQYRRVQEVKSGDTVRIESTNEKNDLPHQVLSAWAFALFALSRDDGGPTRFQGMVNIVVNVERGLDIPLYPAHPDRWNGKTEMHLLSGGQTSLWWGGSRDGSWSCMSGCPERYVPDEGVIVPFDAAVVEVVIEEAGRTPTRLGLSYHAADARPLEVVEATEETDTRRVYRIPVERGMGDGPYAKASLWEFVPFIDTPEEDSVYHDEYTITATVYKNPV